MPVSLWARAFTQLESELSEKNFNTYIRPLQAVGSGTIPRGRPAQHADKPQSFTEAENACMG